MECWSVSTIDQSPDNSIVLLGTKLCIHPLPGCMIVHTTAGVYTLDPVTLALMPCKMLHPRDTATHSEEDGIPRPQFDIANCILTILSVFNIDRSSSKDRQNMNKNILDSDLKIRSYVAMAINYRLVVMKIMRW